MVILGTASALALSLGTDSSIETLNATPSLRSWSSVSLRGISCLSSTACVATGNFWSQPEGPTVELQLQRGVGTSPMPIPGSAGYADVSVACSRVGECLAVGLDYLAAQHDGQWSGNHAVGVPSAFGEPGFSLTSSCSPGGACGVIDTVSSSSGTRSYALGAVNGRWLLPENLGPPVSSSRTGVTTSVVANGVSCWSRAACTFSGYVQTGPYPHTRLQSFVQTETSGVWRAAHLIPSDQSDRTSGNVIGFPLDRPFECSSRGNCLYGGVVFPGSAGSRVGGVQQEVGGHWLPVVTGVGVTAQSMQSEVTVVACASSRLCVASGGANVDGHGSLFFQAEVQGRWGRTLTIPTGDPWSWFSGSNQSQPTAASCPTPSTCYVVGFVHTPDKQRLAFMATYANGDWSFEPLLLGQGENWTELYGMSCNSGACWVVGDAGISGTHADLGFAYQVVLPPH